jgi:hypothetical protein
MKTFSLLIVLALASLTGVTAAVDSNVSTEPLGKLALGQKAEAVLKLLGEPTSKGKDTRWEAIGEWVQEWRFPAQGLRLAMNSAQKGGVKTVLSITASAGCQLATARGIKIGSSEAAVRKAYAKDYEKEQSAPGSTFVAGSVYGGVIFTFKDGKVGEIFIGAAAE